MRSRRTTLAARIDYLRPEDCGSTIGYTIVRGRRLWATVSLSDCNRKIEWAFDDDIESAKKIDQAIALLSEFRDKFAIARRRRGKARLTPVV